MLDTDLIETCVIETCGVQLSYMNKAFGISASNNYPWLIVAEWCHQNLLFIESGCWPCVLIKGDNYWLITAILKKSKRSQIFNMHIKASFNTPLKLIKKNFLPVCQIVMMNFSRCILFNHHNRKDRFQLIYLQKFNWVICLISPQEFPFFIN